MNSLQRQRGMTMWGLIFVLFVLGFTLFITFKVWPPYVNDLKVKKALDSVATESQTQTLSRQEVLTGLEKRFQIDDTQHVNLRNDLTFEAKGDQTGVTITYEVVVPLFGNVSLLLSFQHSVNVRGGGS